MISELILSVSSKKGVFNMDIKTILKLKEIDQLDSAILQFSKNTLTSKKLCASLLVGIFSLILKLTNNVLDNSLFFSSFISVLVFWIIDSFSYYYQKKIRIRMSEIVDELYENNQLVNGYGMPLSGNIKASWIKSMFNFSQLFYHLILLLLIIAYIMFKNGIIG